MAAIDNRLTGIDNKLAVVMEFQRNLSWLSPAFAQHVVQAAQIPRPAAAAAAVEQPVYNTAATYDALLLRQQLGQAVGASLPAPTSGFAAYPSYLLSSANVEQRLQQEADGYAGEQCFYNDEEYQDDGLGYEIPPNYLPLTSQELFLSGGDATRSVATPPILPGFFSNSVKQSISAATAGPVPVVQSAALNLVTVTSVAKSGESVTQSVLSTAKSVSVSTDASGLPSATQTLARTSPLAAPKLVPSSAVVTEVTSSLDGATKTDAGNKALFGGFSFTAAPPVVLPDKGKDDKKSADKAALKADNPFANFSFSSPADSNTADKAGLTRTVSKPTFGGLSSLSANAPSSSTTVGDRSSGSELPIFGSGVKEGAATFADLASQEVKGFSPKVDNSDVFKATGNELFQHSSAKSAGSPRKANLSGHEDDEEYVPDQEFQPIVSLPEVEVRTGEEDEEKLFGERAKLYRLDDNSKQWKERGIGEIKILRHGVSGRFRIVMRREQVLKLCANHYITASMKLVPLKTSETSLCWVANDYSEGDVRKEQLCIKFKTSDIMQKFRICFEDCQLKCGEQKTDQAQPVADSQSAESADSSKPLSALFKPKSGQWVCSGCYITNESKDVVCIACMSPKPAAAPAVSGSAATPAVTVSDAAPLSSLFQAKPGEWDCASCYIRNGADRTSCAACETPKPGTAVTTDNSASTVSESTFKIAPTGGFTFSAIGAKSFTFGGSSSPFTPGTAATVSSQSTAVATSVTPFSCPPPPTPVFTFGTPQTGSSRPSVKPGPSVFQSLSKPPGDSAVASVFQTSSSTPSFALLSSTSASDKAASSKATENRSLFGSSSFVFQGVKPVSSLNSLTSTDTSSFKFTGLSPATPAQQPATLSPSSPTSPDNELYETGADDEPNVSFEPVVQLPDNVEVKTGEEDEDVLYCQRSKLYRFVDGEWKERGIGDVKLLRHRSTGIVRVVMRRERVLKLCLNHRVNATLTLQPMPNAQGKAWTWHADDFSDGSEPMHEKFSIRFKTEDIAAEFKQAFDRVKNGEILPAVDSSATVDADPKCPGPSVLDELLAESTEPRGKLANYIFCVIKF